MNSFKEAKKIHTQMRLLNKREQKIHENVSARYRKRKEELLDSASDAVKKLLVSITDEEELDNDEQEEEEEQEQENEEQEEEQEEEEQEEQENEGRRKINRRRRLKRK